MVRLKQIIHTDFQMLSDYLPDFGRNELWVYIFRSAKAPHTKEGRGKLQQKKQIVLDRFLLIFSTVSAEIC